MALAGVCNQLTLAREYALLGDYDISLEYFGDVLAQVDRHIRNKDDAYMQKKWLKVKNELVEEIELVKQLDGAKTAIRYGKSTSTYTRTHSSPLPT
eukprot:CAMPEP_0118946566 /NCGR_PEP_ID=MMETSP1169-20130426/44429_1 /TAXON_ID=36882 /ORGANISM="Pyramimonas obovata, Strain CCMP722" /LENGTH=95 /DNA_ID=CAMNT_0006892567 /DNA_START=123 /DNA_END=406 /DNA_ORIENTATION=-